MELDPLEQLNQEIDKLLSDKKNVPLLVVLVSPVAAEKICVHCRQGGSYRLKTGGPYFDGHMNPTSPAAIEITKKNPERYIWSKFVWSGSGSTYYLTYNLSEKTGRRAGIFTAIIDTKMTGTKAQPMLVISDVKGV